MHLMPDPSGTSAIWAAQRVPEGEACCVPNVFVIRQMDLADEASYLLSRSATETAARLGLWAPGEPFDFAAIFSAGEARHRYYSGRRQWRALSLLAPSLGLSPSYDDLLVGGGYPFSVRCDAPPTPHQLMAIMRDTYAGTPYDLGRGPAAGPFGATDRFDGGNGAKAEPPEDGAFERPIGVYACDGVRTCSAPCMAVHGLAPWPSLAPSMAVALARTVHGRCPRSHRPRLWPSLTVRGRGPRSPSTAFPQVPHGVLVRG